MTRDDIIRMAQECQLIGMRPHLDGIYEEALQRFAAIVAAAEREACAKICDETRYKNSHPFDDWHASSYFNAAAESCAEEIRARGEA